MSRLRWRIGEKLFRFHFHDKKLNSHRGFSPRCLFSESLPSLIRRSSKWDCFGAKQRTSRLRREQMEAVIIYHQSLLRRAEEFVGKTFLFFSSRVTSISHLLACAFFVKLFLSCLPRIGFSDGGMTVTSTLRDLKRLINLRTCREKTLRTI